VLLPQSLRVAIPPLVSQYLTLVKSSSLAVAIGYPDFVAVTNITINQTGQALEGILLIMAVYATISLCLSLLLNTYNRRLLAR
jgi:general L-amino acid transport system permease protein